MREWFSRTFGETKGGDGLNLLKTGAAERFQLL
jgi:hypothetical protein